MMTNAKKTTQKGKGKSSATEQFGGTGLPKLRWVNVYFNDDDLEELHDQVNSINVIVCEFILNLPEEYDLSAKHDARSDRWAARVICLSSEHGNANCAVTVRAATRLDALYALAFAFAHKLPDKWSDGDDTPQPRFG